MKRLRPDQIHDALNAVKSVYPHAYLRNVNLGSYYIRKVWKKFVHPDDITAYWYDFDRQYINHQTKLTYGY